MPIEDVLLDLKNKIEKNLPAGVTITDVEFEGPQLVLYTEEPRKFADDGNIIRNLAKSSGHGLPCALTPGYLLLLKTLFL